MVYDNSDTLKIDFKVKQDLMEVDVSRFVEERVGRGRKTLDYIPWVEAQLMLEEFLPTLEVRFVESERGKPFFVTEQGAYILVYLFCVERGCKTYPMFYPVMDNSHGPVQEPDMNQINTSLWRASVKCIAVQTGLGLSVFRKLQEDLPPSLEKAPTRESWSEEEELPTPAKKKPLGLGLGKKLS